MGRCAVVVEEPVGAVLVTAAVAARSAEAEAHLAAMPGRIRH